MEKVNKNIKIGLFILSAISILSLSFVLIYSVVHFGTGFSNTDDTGWWTTLALLFSLTIGIIGFNLFKERDLENISKKFDELKNNDDLKFEQNKNETIEIVKNNISEIISRIDLNSDLTNLQTYLFDIVDEANSNNTEKWNKLLPVIKNLYKKGTIDDGLVIRLSSIAWKQNAVQQAFMIRDYLYEQNPNFTRYRSYAINTLLYLDDELCNSFYNTELKNAASFKKFIIPEKQKILKEEYDRFVNIENDDISFDSYKTRQVIFGYSIWLRYCLKKNKIDTIIEFFKDKNNEQYITLLTERYTTLLRTIFLVMYYSKGNYPKIFDKYINLKSIKKNPVFHNNDNTNYLIFRSLWVDILAIDNDSFKKSDLIAKFHLYMSSLSVRTYYRLSLYDTYNALNNKLSGDDKDLILNLYLVFYWLCGIDDKKADIKLNEVDIFEIINALRKYDGTTINIVHLADSANNEYDSNQEI